MQALILHSKDPMDLRDTHFDSSEVELFQNGDKSGFIVKKAEERLTLPIEDSCAGYLTLYGYTIAKFLCVGVYNGDERYEGRQVYKLVQ